jgi:glycosyltransferase involved in cell wall biosynthesis
MSDAGRISTERPRILQIAHNHPRFHPGGTELTALALHRQALASGLDSWYLGALDEDQTLPGLGTQMIALSDDQRESALFTSGFDRFPLSQLDQFGFLREFMDYLRAIQPDVIHLHHVLNFGLEAFFAIRRTLPDVRIVLTLHDYYLICANNGQLYKHDIKQRCPGPTLAECLKCRPDKRASDFAMRALDIRNALSLCDHLVSPSHFLKDKFDRYLQPEHEITVIENGYLGADIAPAASAAADDQPATFGYFGNVSAVKGLADLLDAADVLTRSGVADFRIAVHGAQLFEDKILYDRIQAAKASLGDRIVFLGQYQPEDMGRHLEDIDCLVFPSVWWENAPLVIYEALYHGRQVISYPHGGAPEILARYGMGIPAQRSDPTALADAMRTLIEDRSLAAKKPDRTIPGRDELLRNYLRLYQGARG